MSSADNTRCGFGERWRILVTACEHTFVFAQGSAHSRFARAVDRREVFQAEAAARELARLSLNDALSLVCLYATAGSPKFDPAAVRWLSRLGLEEAEVTLTTMQLAADALVQLHGHDHQEARETLLRLLWAAANRMKSKHS